MPVCVLVHEKLAGKIAVMKKKKRKNNTSFWHRSKMAICNFLYIYLFTMSLTLMYDSFRFFVFFSGLKNSYTKSLLLRLLLVAHLLILGYSAVASPNVYSID